VSEVLGIFGYGYIPFGAPLTDIEVVPVICIEFKPIGGIGRYEEVEHDTVHQ